jgi:ADP-heptose:LPS heptosyltransferase
MRDPGCGMLDNPASILIVQPSSLGDVVHTLPAVWLIKRHWPEARISWVINPEWAPLLDGNRHVDRVIHFPRRSFRGVRGILRIAPWAREVREKTNADLVLDFQGLLRSALIAKLCRSDRGRIVGLSDAREGARHFYDEQIDVSGCTHAVDRYLALAFAIGAGMPPPLSWSIPFGSEPAGFSTRKRYVVLHPFSRGKGKSLGVDDVAEFCRVLAPMRVVVVGRGEERVLAMENVSDLLNGTTISELIWLLRRAAFVVSVDSGPMHIAAAITPLLVSIHTWSDPAKVGPFSGDAWVWKEGELFQRRDGAPKLPVADVRALAQFVRRRLDPPEKS